MDVSQLTKLTSDFFLKSLYKMSYTRDIQSPELAAAHSIYRAKERK